jgi:hypothetical protein
MTEKANPFEQAEQEIIQSGRPKPTGEPWPRCLIDALIVFAAEIPIVLFVGRNHGEAMWSQDKTAMWAIAIFVGVASLAIRTYPIRSWSRNCTQRALQIMLQAAREERRRADRRGSQ